MQIDQTTPGLRMYPRQKSLIIAGYLPQVQNLDVEVTPDEIVLSGEADGADFSQSIPVEDVINERQSLSVFDEGRLLIIMPRR